MYITNALKEETNLLIMKAATHKERQQAEALLETHYVEQISSNMWGAFDNKGNIIDRGKTKTAVLFYAVSAEGKVDELLN